MSATPRNWLPASAFSPGAVSAALAEPLAGWSRHWFGSAAASVQFASADRSGEGDARASGAVARAALPGPGKRRLLEAALAVDLGSQTLSMDDRLLLDAFGMRIVDDLIAKLDDAIGCSVVGSDWIEFALYLKGREVLSLSLLAGAIVPAMKKTMTASARREPVGGRMAAIGSTPVVLHGVLGSADVSLAEIDELGVGDVLVLDRPLGDAVDLRLCTEGPAVRGRLRREHGRLIVHL